VGTAREAIMARACPGAGTSDARPNRVQVGGSDPDGKRLYALGVHNRGELVRYQSSTKQFVPYLGGISAWHVAPSRDGKWNAYVSCPDGALWRSRADGTGRLQLTSPPMQATMPQWSPDGRHIAFMGYVAGQPWAVYVVSTEGGVLERVLKEDRHQTDPSWSPDDTSVAFGRVPWAATEVNSVGAITVVNVSTKRASDLPGSERFYSPRWSPDGRYAGTDCRRSAEQGCNLCFCDSPVGAPKR
jgi:dipeptidyl aminopeptidase/acylaminoacyl peptidase